MVIDVKKDKRYIKIPIKSLAFLQDISYNGGSTATGFSIHIDEETQILTVEQNTYDTFAGKDGFKEIKIKGKIIK